MSRLYADIHKKTGGFELNVLIESDASRIGILGESGSGKSMTLKSIAGIEAVDSGHIEIDGRVLYDSDRKIDLKPQKRNVGYMFQNYALFPTMSVLKNVMAGLGRATEENLSKAADMLRRFRMDGYEDKLPGELSGGQQQRVALARIMVTEPSLILLDEPYSALDSYLRDRMQVEMLEMLEDYAGQVVMVSHSRDELYRFSEELFIVSEGCIIRHGDTKSVFREPEKAMAARLTGCKNLSAARRIDEHTVEVPDWGIILDLKRTVPQSTSWVGYRAHSFEPVWGEAEENCIKCDLIRVDDLPFEKNYYIRSRNSEAPLCWFVQGEEQRVLDERGLPDYLRLNEDDILLLE
ncbi:MAG: ATP-binding cassette domain-containing protein [Mogibacterium sp.]|nr:ATP-binding cassette domain-containing protein [Mogibacterium sp.]